MSIHINLELTDHCNLKCKMCSQSLRDLAHGQPMTFMNFETWKHGICGLEEMEGELSISPHWLGEPTLHPEFDKFIRYAFEQNHNNKLFREFKLHTNAVIFPNDRSNLILELANTPSQFPNTFRFVHFSIDAYSRDVYLSVKGGDRRNQVYDNITRFLKRRYEQNVAFPKIALGFVVQPENHSEARSFLEYWKYQLELFDCPVHLCSDWPDREMDSIYFRPLNTKHQEQANRLHQETVQRLGIHYKKRSANSF